MDGVAERLLLQIGALEEADATLRSRLETALAAFPAPVVVPARRTPLVVDGEVLAVAQVV
jgi:uncharacterized phage protein gp47/JayE